LFIKPIRMPVYLLILQAILRRLPKSHHRRHEIEQDYARRYSGFKGEQSLDYYLSFLPQKDFFIFHGLRLKGDQHHFQMDFLILTSFYFLIIEVKNNTGTIMFDDQSKQMIQTKDEIEYAYTDPVLQVNHQRFQLKKWLKTKKIPAIPIETVVVFTNPKVILRLKNENSSHFDKVIIGSYLLNWIGKCNNAYRQSVQTSNELKKLSNRLLKHHAPHSSELLKQYEISSSDILTGVQCPACSFFAMKWVGGQWYCPTCSSTSKDAHIDALIDYSFLFQPTITNKQLRTFLHIPSESVAYKLLSKMNLPKEGSNKNRTYHLHYNHLTSIKPN
jgi:hypothetical protein